MADVIGPNSYLPGQRLTPPDGMMCDCCDVNPATIRIVGETDSFGSELNDYCQTCYDAEQAENPDAGNYICDRCHRDAPCKPRRDPEEGRCGPVYWYCEPCTEIIVKAQQAYYADDEEY